VGLGARFVTRFYSGEVILYPRTSSGGWDVALGALKAILRLRLQDGRLARALYEAVKPDNELLPEGLEVRGSVKGSLVGFEVSCSKGLGSLWATLDDLLACLQTAEKALRALGAG